MKIINAGLEFGGTIPRKDEDPYSLALTKIMICREGTDINVPMLHQEYKDENGIGLPYNYVVKTDGLTYFIRSRKCVNGLNLPHSNALNNAVLILVEGEPGSYTVDSFNSICELCTMAIVQENLFVTDIISEYDILHDISSDDSEEIPSRLITRVSTKVENGIDDGKYRITGDYDNEAGYSKLVTNKNMNTLKLISDFTGIQQSVITDMNSHVNWSTITTIPVGTTLFVPDNKMTGYVKDSFAMMKSNFIYEKIKGVLGR